MITDPVSLAISAGGFLLVLVGIVLFCKPINLHKDLENEYRQSHLEKLISNLKNQLGALEDASSFDATDSVYYYFKLKNIREEVEKANRICKEMQRIIYSRSN